MTPSPHDPRLELRVLSGRQAGARAALHAQQPLLIVGCSGSQQGDTQFADILLATDSEVQAQLLPDGRGRYRLQLIEGTAELAGQALGPAVTAHSLAPGQRLRLGGVLLAYGPAGQAHWPEPVLLGDGETATAGATGGRTAGAAGLAPGWWHLELALFGLGGLLLLGGLWLAWPGGTLLPMAQAQAAQPGAPGPLPPGPATPLRAGELMASVVDLFRLNGIAAQASWTPQGELLLQTREPDAARLQSATAAARRDLAQLPPLRIDNQPPAPPATTETPVDDPAKRLVAVVDNADSPFFVTADGSRYFGGALLPSGHRVVEIAERAVVVERDGLRTRLSL
ncbi:SctD/MshK family protein [Aquabacterium sp. OR-4]|uniref:SctD/MshK family protein n=1 Tax=Aquabacterium sp. OR-4 TaxID=2978127 RepID=UPI0028C978B3|nr:hypothetical protein [Aquabacterium sp. OR-4]MDT7837974.1 hypothetical protein [Aquabacterium sp. OR-4]